MQRQEQQPTPQRQAAIRAFAKDSRPLKNVREPKHQKTNSQPTANVVTARLKQAHGDEQSAQDG
jgi:hypothetical protein